MVPNGCNMGYNEFQHWLEMQYGVGVKGSNPDSSRTFSIEPGDIPEPGWEGGFGS